MGKCMCMALSSASKSNCQIVIEEKQPDDATVSELS